MILPEARLLAPRYWLWWLGLGCLWLLTWLPYAWQLHIGRAVGWCLYQLGHRRRHIATVNIRLCFPELDAAQQALLVKQHFASLGIALLEIVNAWWRSDARIKFLGHVEGEHNLHAALARARGKGVILLGSHFTTLEIGLRFLTMRHPIYITYRAHENPLVEFMLKRSREHHTEKAIPRDSIRDMLRSLKANKFVWFAIDQNFGHKNSVFAPFFGIPAATNTATARIAQISGAVVVPLYLQRLPNAQGYKLTIHPALENFPSNDALHDATRINQLIEEQVELAPEQYLWVHRRFKDRPTGMPNVYK